MSRFPTITSPEDDSGMARPSLDGDRISAPTNAPWTRSSRKSPEGWYATFLQTLEDGMGPQGPLRTKARSPAAPSHPCFGAVAPNLANRTGRAARAIGKSRSGRRANNVLRGTAAHRRYAAGSRTRSRRRDIAEERESPRGIYLWLPRPMPPAPREQAAPTPHTHSGPHHVRDGRCATH